MDRLRCGWLAWLWLPALACSSRSHPQPAPADTPATPSASAPPAAKASARPPPRPVRGPLLPPAPAGPSLPPPIALARAVACAFDAHAWEGASSSTKLLIGGGGPPFAVAWIDRVRLHLPVALDNRGALLELDGQGVSLRAFVNERDARLRAARAFLIGDVAIPTPGAALLWESASEGEIAVRLPLDGEVDSKFGPLITRRPCDDLAIERVEFDASALLGASKRPASLAPGRSTPLSPDPGGPASLLLTPKGSTAGAVSILDSRGAQTRIAWRRTNEILVGWVPSSDVIEEAHETFAGLGLSGVGAGCGLPEPLGLEKRTCAQDLPLIAAVGPERVTVGQVKAGALIEVFRRSGGFAEVRLPLAGLAASDGARLLVPADALGRCSKR